jgi:hypothetical protein
MKIIILTTFLFLFAAGGTFAQQPIEINGFRIIEINGEYYDISSSDTLKIVSDVVTLKYNEIATTEVIENIELTYNLVKSFHAPTGWINYKIRPNDDIVDIMQDLTLNNFVYRALFNRVIPYLANPDESAWVQRPELLPLVDELCGLANIPYNVNHLLMEVDLAWDVTAGSADIIIGFIDSGTAIEHPNLGEGNDTYHNLWQHPENPNVFGWNFIDQNSNVNDSWGESHGTLVASIACAKTNNNLGTFGVAGGWNNVGSRIMTLKAGDENGINEDKATEAIYYAVANGARIINMSWGNPNTHHESLEDAINYAYENFNCLFFAASGNNPAEPVAWPANHPFVNAVGASMLSCVQTKEERWTFPGGHQGSATGEELCIVTPSHAYTCHVANGFHWHTQTAKTSGATAYVSGVAALILSTNPCLTNIEVAEILKSTADKIDADNTTPEAQYDPVTGHSLWYGYGRINAYQAVLAALDKEGEPAYTVTGNETWNDRRRFSGNITVEDGGILTITSILFMDSHTKIIVEPGGKLIVDGGTITTACLDPWRGIEVLGNPNLDQTPPSQQGWVVVINGGTIANALAGIRAGVLYDLPDSGGTLEIKATGGIIQVNNAVFKNNKIAIEWLPYTHASISYAKHSTFITDMKMLDAINPDYFIKLSGINILEISNCEFTNSRSWLNEDDPAQGSGIYAWHAGIKSTCAAAQTPCPPTGYHPNKFNNLYRGIYALNSGSNRTVSIINHVFNSTYRGLYLSGVNNARITSNEFFINTPFKDEGGYGLYLDACSGYWVEDNELRHNGQTPLGVGMIVNNSGTYPNEIYRNRFINLEAGISAQGINRDQSRISGLQILCNNFIDGYSDILIPNLEQTPGWGIAVSQGANSQNPRHMAGNLFHHHTAVDFNDINNEGENIIYYYPNNHDQQYERVIPLRFTTNTVNAHGVYFTPEWNYVVGCPCKLNSGGGGHEEEMKQQMAESGQEAIALQETLELLIDSGDTESLFWDVNMSSPPEAMQVYQELMNTSPYLSDTVVSATIVKEDVLIDAMLRDIMVANPHSAKSGKLLEELDQRWIPLPDYMRAQIMQGKNMVSVRESMESTLAWHQLDKATAVNALARNWHNNADSLVWLWSADNSPASKYKLAFLYLELGQAAQGATVLYNIPTQFNMSGAQHAGHEQIAALYDILASIAQEEKCIMEADSLLTATLLEIEAGSTGLAGVYARNAMLALQAIEYDEPIILPDIMKSRAMAEAYTQLLETRSPKNLSVFPIPARDYLAVEYVVDTESNGMIEFTDASGKLVHTLTVSGPVNKQIVDTRNWKQGWYLATLKTLTKTLESVKFIISD